MSFLIPDINTFFLLHTHFFSLLVYHVPILSCNPTVYTLCTVSTWGSVYVCQDNGGLRCQCSGNRHSLLLTSRQCVRKIIQLLAQSKQFNNFFQINHIRLSIIQSDRQNDVLPDIQRGDKIKCLKNETDFSSAKCG